MAVDVVLPARSNHRLADIARHASLRDMAAAGADIWLCTAMVHAKAVLFDEDLALVGSANLDERSLFLNYEMMVAFFAPGDVKRFLTMGRAPACGCQALYCPPTWHSLCFRGGHGAMAGVSTLKTA
ncbi:phospholipase D-like domain-containing protein [Candidatus Aalborgicola defluviihabitans]|uniref:phospholipase D-like domain-containing protein n=1 Tax=Candidatus Aalborgicola defluviihabitans TaxID=3386187 RepID=UPI0039B99404